ncbi:MAG: peptidylprolyl isomerase [Rickettsiales bacterium]
MNFRLRLSCAALAAILIMQQWGARNALADSAGIVALVGDRAVITSTDVEQRIKLIAFSSGAPYTKKTAKDLFPQVLRLLTDEEILRQEADKLNLSVSPSELNDAVLTLEKENNMPQGTMSKLLADRGVPYSTLQKQLEGQLLQRRLLASEVKPHISVSRAEVDEEMDNIVNKLGYYEVKLSEIVLPAKAGEEEAILRAAKELIARIEGGASFEKIAREFSRAPSASEGGETAWTGIDKLSDSLQAVVEKMDVGQLTNPIFSDGAYRIFRLDNKRAMILNDAEETEIGLKRIFRAVNESDPKELSSSARDFAKAKAEYKGGCDGFSGLAKILRSGISPDTTMLQVKELDKRLLPSLSNLPIGRLSAVIKGNSGMNLFMICERTKARPTRAARKKVEEMLLQKKGLLESKRYLQDLRSRYFVEIRA